ncbi:MAG: UDP-N-acetylglucosamine 1-carboxyvinyltransferase [Oscillospiraceae bacterium]|nr:UDP-N-acetylglucosamine 1-carboxyvinyltransferase [Oscillospiraceae bacterium]
MDGYGKYSIIGGNRLYGELSISGAKNSAVAVIAAAMTVNGLCHIDNMPQVRDVEILLQILQQLGAEIDVIGDGDYMIDCRNIDPDAAIDQELYGQLRASYYVLGALLGRFGHARVAMPGGCDFGTRPIDYHIKGFEALGAEVDIGGGWIDANAVDGLRGTRILLDYPSVGATINIILAAIYAEGLTIIENAAMEPHIVDFANCLNAMGAEVRGAGTNSIRIYGVNELRGGSYTIVPDQIEAGTYIALVAGTGGDVIVRDVIPRHLVCITSKLSEMGVEIEDLGDAVRVRREGRPIRRANVMTGPYPGFPTDMQPQVATLLTLARGTSFVTETVWDSRFQYVDQLQRMGAKITTDARTAVIEGVGRLKAASIAATDLRSGAAMVIAGLCADGTTLLDNIWHIERGYGNIIAKLGEIGADITRVVDAPRNLIELRTHRESVA